MLNTVRQRGFNLIEVMVIVTVLALLIAAGIPSMGEWIRSVRVRNTAEIAMNGLQKARNEAMKRNQVVAFWLVGPAGTAKPDATCELSASSAAWVVSLDDPTGKCDVAASPTTAPRIIETWGPGESAAGIVVTAVDQDDNQATSVRFNAFGQPLPGSAPIKQIDFEDAQAGTRRLRIQISAGGGVRMCDRDVDAPDPRACL